MGDVVTFRLRDFPMHPKRGVHGDVRWRQFVSTLQLRIPLRGAEWDGVKEETFYVKISAREIIVRCMKCCVMEDFNASFQDLVCPKQCWYCLERDANDPSNRSRVLCIEVTKR